MDSLLFHRNKIETKKPIENTKNLLKIVPKLWMWNSVNVPRVSRSLMAVWNLLFFFLKFYLEVVSVEIKVLIITIIMFIMP